MDLGLVVAGTLAGSFTDTALMIGHMLTDSQLVIAVCA